MIISDKIEIKIAAPNKKYYEKTLNKFFNIGDIVSVNIEDIPEKSSVMIKCKCDSCSRVFSQRRYRDFSVCGHCKTKKRMTGNNYGNKNIKHMCPNIRTLLKMISNGFGKQAIAKKFNANIQTVNRWLKENDIDIKKYRGLTYFKNTEEEEAIVENIKKLVSQDKNISEISKTLNITRSVLKTLVKNNDIKILSAFQKWEDQYENILSNMSQYIKENETKTLNEISNDHNCSIEQLKKAFRESNINPRIHSYNKSKGELECREYIRSLGVTCDSYKFEKTFEIDCFVSSHNFGVEYCGEYWHRFDPNKDNKKYHQNKFDFFASKDIKLMTIYENEWKNKKDLLHSMIKNRLGIVDNKIFARKCKIIEISKTEADAFHLINHISGNTTSSLNYGLYHENDLVSVLSFIRSRFDRNFEYEISRFSSMKNTVVMGGLSRLFNHFIKEVNPESCMTYADLRFGEGKSYEKIGFTYLSMTQPNYHYYDNKTGKMENRMKFQKSKLINLPEYDPNKTELEIMQNSGYYRLYDCGNKKYGWKKTSSHP